MQQLAGPPCWIWIWIFDRCRNCMSFLFVVLPASRGRGEEEDDVGKHSEGQSLEVQTKLCFIMIVSFVRWRRLCCWGEFKQSQSRRRTQKR
jgi:hypothetical protein